MRRSSSDRSGSMAMSWSSESGSGTDMRGL
jgi:hypothetical protein